MPLLLVASCWFIELYPDTEDCDDRVQELLGSHCAPGLCNCKGLRLLGVSLLSVFRSILALRGQWPMARQVDGRRPFLCLYRVKPNVRTLRCFRMRSAKACRFATLGADFFATCRRSPTTRPLAPVRGVIASLIRQSQSPPQVADGSKRFLCFNGSIGSKRHLLRESCPAGGGQRGETGMTLCAQYG